jgi:cation:H+ antiporter
MLLASGAVVLGFVLLILGGDLLVRGAEKLAVKLHLTPAVIGLTIVAFGTSVPELVVSLLAAFDGNPDIALGNVVGSNILNIALVMGGTSLLIPLIVSKDLVRIHGPFMFLLSCLLVVLAWDLVISRFDGAFLFFLLIVFTVWMIRRTRVAQQLQSQENLSDAQVSFMGPAIKVGIGIVLLWWGGKTALWGAVELATLWGLTERVIALTVVALGTSMPELVTSLVSVMRKQDDIALGNIIGSNIYNIGCVLGVTSLMTPISVDPQIIAVDVWMMLGVVLFFLPVALIFKSMNRGSGVIYVITLSIYMLWLLHPATFG